MNEPARFRTSLSLILTVSIATIVSWSAGLSRAADSAVNLASGRSNPAGQADIRILGAVSPVDPSDSRPVWHIAQRGAPLPLPEPDESGQPDNGGPPTGSPQTDVPPGEGPARIPGVPANPRAPGGPAAPAQNPLPLRRSQTEEIDGGWKPIGAVRFNPQMPAGDLPQNLAAARFARAGEIVATPGQTCNNLAYTYYWEASSFCCGPLYFEEPNLERYGYTHGILQPIISGLHFFTTVPLLPYKMVVHPPCKCVYTLGHYRPGDPVPRQRVRDPFRLDAALVEVGFIAGLFLIVP